MDSLIAGGLSGAFEGFVTYPTEFVKTRSQFSAQGVKTSPIQIIKSTISEHGVKGLYSGCSALVIGNAVKAGVRFLSYDSFKKSLVDKDEANICKGKLTAPRSLLAGLGAGTTEAIFAVTPSETIKTKLIDDAKSKTPRFNGLVHGTSLILKEQGIRGLYSGLVPVIMRQAANSAVRFTTYSSLKQFVQGNSRPGQTLPASISFAIGSVAGIVTVYSTMPLDVLKTRMQGLNARTEYRNSIHCAYRIFTEEGLTRFWKGTTPRLARLSMSGGIVFASYEQIMGVLNKLKN
ncbi:hypothetical protein E3Q22_03010 [Wallemia mellicola]|uniref:Mitochondrial tricarboxylate transporter n=1 Tax=Wallemia mellicola TaxID=1708541 RepID=A0A4T0MMG5_9BASI|nr:hypothetical protein E3Q22_03010 [Wallemia mellicola]TIB84591.1 hypothetical protein E3Q21_02325 [Wallemia mellicola]TIB87837.1 hypothetical protein E3Q20_02320 [Wallemia mellicola]TIB98795.1 hypothetical protein E3Q17_02882 [Wallemia mellicola]TIC04886.1 hypothetical protein E3Q16_02490 [Wallemia mellicola]